jgi:hypothetical protein
MCGGPNPETRMEKLVFEIESNSCAFSTENCEELRELTVTEVAEILGCTNQVAGKVMACWWDLWEKRIRTIDGKRTVIYIPKKV